MILDDDLVKDDGLREESSKSDTPTEHTSVLPQVPSKYQIIKRVLHTRTEIIIYPDGKTFQNSKSWFENDVYQVVKKQKQKSNAGKKAAIEKVEEY